MAEAAQAFIALPGGYGERPGTGGAPCPEASVSRGCAGTMEEVLLQRAAPAYAAHAPRLHHW